MIVAHYSADVEKCLDRNSDVQKTAANIQFNTVPGRSGKSESGAISWLTFLADIKYIFIVIKACVACMSMTLLNKALRYC